MAQFTGDLSRLMAAQREFFDSGATRPYEFRTEQLRRLRRAIRAHEAEIFAALKMDMGKPEMEAYASEIGFVYEEIRYMLRRLRSWMAPRRVGTPLAAQPATSFILSEPLGEVLIISPWNYPFLLLVSPLLGAIAGGNCAVLKPSELAPHTADVIEKVIAEAFPAHYVATVQGGPDVAQALLARQWDYIFFTGSAAVGRIVAQAAAERLTPTTLELGGKSPGIVHRDAKLDLATVRRFPKPLSLYLFTGDRHVEERILRDLPFGGGCINDTLMHLTNPHLPFGGVGPSGMGAYHGKFSFDTFTHRKGILRSLPAVELHARYQPYRGKMRLARMVMR